MASCEKLFSIRVARPPYPLSPLQPGTAPVAVGAALPCLFGKRYQLLCFTFQRLRGQLTE